MEIQGCQADVPDKNHVYFLYSFNIKAARRDQPLCQLPSIYFLLFHQKQPNHQVLIICWRQRIGDLKQPLVKLFSERFC